MASDVVSLGSDTFPEFVDTHALVLAKFYAPWCGHCKTLAPEYETAATELKAKDISLVEIDCTESQELCAEHKVQGYPTLMVFRDGQPAPYNGGRTSPQIIKYMESELLPPVTEVTLENLESFADEEVAGLALFEKKDEAFKNYTSIAAKFHHQLTFGSTFDPAVAEKLGVTTFPSFVVFSKHLEKPAVLDTTADFAFEEKPIVEHLMRNSLAPAGEIGPESFRAYMVSGLPLAYLFYSNAEERERYEPALLELAKEFHGVVNIGFIDSVKYGSHAPNINLNEHQFPAFAVHDITTNKKFPIKQDTDLSPKVVAQHLRDFIAGTLIPDVKSEPVPEKQEGPVYKAVLGNYDELVLDEDKDVLIEFYAPWCGHCKKLAPIYEELGALYFNHPQLKHKVAVAQMDHTANELEGIEIAGYPTIMLFPAGNKKEPIVFESGARTLENLNAFIRDKGTHGVDGLKSQKKKTKRSKKAKKAKKVKSKVADEL